MITSTVLVAVELDMLLLEVGLGLCDVDGGSVGVLDTEPVVGDGELED